LRALRTPPFAALALAASLAWASPALGQAAAAAAANAPTIAVLDFTGLMVGQGGNSAPLGKAVSAMLVTELIGRPGIRVIERAELHELLNEQKLSLSGRVDESTALEVGKLVGAQYVIHGQVTSIADNLRMDMRAVDVATSEIMEVQKLSGKTDDLLDVVVKMADLFSGKLKLPPPPAKAPEKIPVLATVAFSRGIDFEDKGDIPHAIEQYKQALQLHPNHRDAKAAVERLERGGD
jgi:curli biogenesis system outer membrane secretion channel CsgG